MAEPRVDPPRGLLNLELAEGRVHLARYFPSAESLTFFVEHYWIVRWQLAGQPPFTSETLPYPSVHVVLEQGDSRVVGVPRGRFERLLRGDGFVFGIKFRPGGFRPFVAGPVSRFTNRSVALASVLGYGAQLAEEVLAAGSDATMIECAETLVLGHLPAPDPQIPLLTTIVDAIAADRSIVRVEQLVSAYGLGKRTLQRLFREYVGVTPKWVIQRYRLFEAAERLTSGESDGAALAQELGYFDQAHFIRDFKAMIGRTPQVYARTLADSDSRARQRVRGAIKRDAADTSFVASFVAAIQSAYPGCPAAEAEQIAEHACRRSSGRIGRTAAARELDPKAVRLAVQAHVRHAHTDYDRLLVQLWDRGDARGAVRGVVDDVLRRWAEPIL